MPLGLKITKGNFSSQYILISDGTGDFEGSTNPTGWGPDNIIRETANLGLVAIKKASDGNVILDVDVTEPTGATVNTVTGWKVNLQGDGHQKITMFVAPTYDDLTVYSRYDVVYNDGDSKFYYYTNTEDSVAGPFTTDNGWSEALDSDLIEKSTQNGVDDGFYRTTLNDFITEGTKVCIAKKSIDILKSEDCKHCSSDLFKSSNKVTSMMIAAEALAAVGNFLDGQEAIEKAEDICGNTKSGGCNC